MTVSTFIRTTDPGDLAAVTAIYGDAVRTSTASFELDPPDLAEMTRRYEATLAGGFPHLVAVRDGAIIGYAYAGPFRTRPAYRFTCEDSVYVAPSAHRTGAGRALLEALLRECVARGLRQMIAGVSGGAASLALHEAMGFRVVGTMQAVGFKFDRWVDVVFLQRALDA